MIFCLKSKTGNIITGIFWKIGFPAISFFLCLFTSETFAQTTNTLPHLIPPSPAAMQFQKYGDYPVSNNTGIPAISIPIYTIKVGDLTVPISLSYHASGTKPSDINGFVGLGWIVDCGGTITRTIIDGADEFQNYPTPFYTQAQLDGMTPPARDNILYQWEDSYDSEPDMFSYNFGGNSGRFVVKRDANFTPLLLPYKPIQFSFPSISPLNIVNAKDLHGYQYEFHATESPTYPGLVGPTRWDLTKLTSCIDTTNFVSFEYTNFITGLDNDITSTFSIDDQLLDNSELYFCGGATPLDDMEDFPPVWDHGSLPQDYTQGVYPSLITFKNGQIKFIKDATTSMLDHIEIYNGKNQLLTSIKFTYVQKPTNRVLLKSVSYYDANNTQINSYNLNYFNETFGIVPDAYHAGVDWWGYFNYEFSHVPGSDISPPFMALMPNWTVSASIVNSTYDYVTGNLTREPNEDAMKTFVLNEMIYPTGGKTVFDFEANQYQKGNFNFLAGGLRIKSITNYSYLGATPEVKTYKYGNASVEDGFGILDFYPGDKTDYVSSQLYYIVNAGNVIDDPVGNSAGKWVFFRRRIFSSSPTYNFTPHGSPVVYPYVTEYFGDNQNNTGKIMYSYDLSTPGLEDINYLNAQYDGSAFAPSVFRKREKFYQDWTSGNLVSKEYDQIKDNVVKRVRYEVNDYDYLQGETLRGVYMERFVNFLPVCNLLPQWTGPHGFDQYMFMEADQSPPSVYNYADYYIQAGETRLTRSTVYNFNEDQGEMLTTTKDYEYGNSIHDQPTAIITTNSKGETIRNELKYPHDFSSLQPYSDMVNITHKWSPVIENSTYKIVGGQNSFLKAQKTDYGFWNGTSWSSTSTNMILPKDLQMKNFKLSDYENRLNYLSYDSKGNLQSVAKSSDVNMSYIWDYNASYPIAEVANAIPTDIAFTSFEADGTGNWNISGGQQVTEDAITGHNSYNLIGSSISKSGLVTGNVYIVSYWSKNSDNSTGNSYTISGGNSSVVPGKSINNWKYYEHTVTASSSTLTITGAGKIDELRIYPKSAQMTTYTYDPLIGMTSQCDVNNRITYYEYDAFGRLKLVRDQDKNILKTIDYKFQATPNQ